MRLSGSVLAVCLKALSQLQLQAANELTVRDMGPDAAQQLSSHPPEQGSAQGAEPWPAQSASDTWQRLSGLRPLTEVLSNSFRTDFTAQIHPGCCWTCRAIDPIQRMQLSGPSHLCMRMCILSPSAGTSAPSNCYCVRHQGCRCCPRAPPHQQRRQHHRIPACSRKSFCMMILPVTAWMVLCVRAAPHQRRRQHHRTPSMQQ